MLFTINKQNYTENKVIVGKVIHAKFSEFFNFIELASQNIKNSILAHKISIQTSKNFFRRFVYADSIK